MYRIIGADGREYGPVTAEQLREWISQGRANAETKALAEGATDWKALGTFPEFSLLLAAQRPSVPVPPMGTPARKTNSLAVAGLIMGIVSLLTCCCYGVPFNVLGLVFSIIALAQIRAHPELYEGQGTAVAGLILSILSLVLAVMLLLVAGLSSWHDNPHRVFRL